MKRLLLAAAPVLLLPHEVQAWGPEARLPITAASSTSRSATGQTIRRHIAEMCRKSVTA
jgi:hypothetical protein